MSLKLCFIGAGNLATQLSLTFYSIGYKIVQVYSRTENSARLLADKLHATYTTNVNNIGTEADLYFIALKDDVTELVISKIDFQNKLVVHCSGSAPLSILEKYSKNIGVFYPLQTFSKNRNVNISSIPIFIEANSETNEKKLLTLARKISNSVSVLNSEKRKIVHVSAVFACNFVNHFYTLSSEILKAENIPFEILKPLILETAAKIQLLEPEKAQTGPAVRFDNNIISEHIKALDWNKNIQELYKTISKSIFDYHKNINQ